MPDTQKATPPASATPPQRGAEKLPGVAHGRRDPDFRIKQRNPESFTDFKTQCVDPFRGIRAVIGSRADGSEAVQSVLFERARWKLPDAKRWIRANRSRLNALGVRSPAAVSRRPPPSPSAAEESLMEWNLQEDRFSFDPAKPVRADVAHNTLHGVKILGLRSSNGREYTPESLRQARPLYEGVKVNLNHPDRAAPDSGRAVEDRFGQMRNVEARADGLYGDLVYNPEHPMARTIVWFAENMPDAIGLSHHALGRGTTRNGRMVVESIHEVRHVDLVADPGTTRGLFEQRAEPTAAAPQPAQAPPRDDADQAPGTDAVRPGNRESEDQTDGAPSASGATGAATDDGDNLATVTLEQLQQARPDLVKALAANLPAPEPARDVTGELQRLREENDRLTAERTLQTKRARAQALVDKARLPREAVSDVFLDQLVRSDDEQAMKILVEDRRKLVFGARPRSRERAAGPVELSPREFAARVRGE